DPVGRCRHRAVADRQPEPDRAVVRAVHGAAGGDLLVRPPAGRGLPRRHRRRLGRAAGDGAVHERRRDLAPQPIRAQVVSRSDMPAGDWSDDNMDTHAAIRVPEVSEREPVSTIEPETPESSAEVVFQTRDLEVHYGAFRAVREVDLDIREHEITAFIGPSGCGKSTVLRCFDRMNDLIEGARVGGTILYHGIDLYGSDVDPVEVRRR